MVNVGNSSENKENKENEAAQMVVKCLSTNLLDFNIIRGEDIEHCDIEFEIAHYYWQ